jgi:RNA polymerase sigma-70 factor (ECF subfamily)
MPIRFDDCLGDLSVPMTNTDAKPGDSGCDQGAADHTPTQQSPHGRDTRDHLEELLPLLYTELHRMAEIQLAGERKGHTLQPTALVNEAYLRLAGQRNVAGMDRNQFLAAASLTIRRILVDYAKTRGRAKRGGSARRVEIEPTEIGVHVDDVDHLAIDDALRKLAAESPRQAQIVELRFYGGCSVEQVAQILSISERTVANEWRFAKAWLMKELGNRTTGTGQ